MANFRPGTLKQGQPLGGTTQYMAVTSGQGIVPGDVDTFYLTSITAPYLTPIWLTNDARPSQRVTIVCVGADVTSDGISITSALSPYTYQGEDVTLFNNDRATFVYSASDEVWYLESGPGSIRVSSGIITNAQAIAITSGASRIPITPAPAEALIIPMQAMLTQYYDTGAVAYASGSLRFETQDDTHNFTATTASITGTTTRTVLLSSGYKNDGWADFNLAPAAYGTNVGEGWFIAAPAAPVGGNEFNYFYYNFRYMIMAPVPK